jgi:hypothetical protein
MDQSIEQIPPAKWQTAVTTIKCEIIDEYVSIMVQKDWTSKCTWYNQYKQPQPEGKKKIKYDKKTRKKIEKCQGPLCSNVTGYRDKLIQEEREVAQRAQSGS